jgi:hypothetical protein
MTARKVTKVTIELTVEDALSGTSSDIEELRDEMESWRDNLEEHFSSTEKYERVSDAASALEDLDVENRTSALVEALELASDGKAARSACAPHVVGAPCERCGWNGHGKATELLAEEAEPAIPEFAGILKATVQFSKAKKRRASRADRATEAASALMAAVEVVMGRCLKAQETLEARLLVDTSAPTVPADQAALRRVAEINELADEVDSICSELAEVDFPGMYG